MSIEIERKMSSKVSIIIPIYNVEKFLNRCIQSVLNQTLNDIEIILVDDGSPDNSSQMCDEYARKDNRIKVIHKKNAGLGYARNSGLDIATGEYVAFLDSDDFVDVDIYRKLYETAISHNLDVCYCGFKHHYVDGRVHEKYEVDKYIEFKGVKEVNGFLLDMIGPEPSYHSDVKYMMCVWKAIYKRKIIEDYHIRFCSERQFVSEDIIFHLDFLPKVQSIGFIPDKLYYYCVNGVTTLTSTYSKEKFERNKILLCEIENRLLKLFPKEQFLNRYYRLCFLYFRTSIVKSLSSIKLVGLHRRMLAVKEIVNDAFFKNMIEEYPYMRLPWKHRILFILVKFKCYRILSIFL